MMKVDINEYHSKSGLDTFASCARKKHYQDNYNKYKPRYRSSALVHGSAIHASINSLHENPHLDSGYIYEQELKAIENEKPEVPVKWPDKKPREWYLKDGRECVTSYWVINQNVKILSNERWFFIPIQVKYGVEWMRGRLDQVIEVGDQWVVRELKTGNAPQVEVLKRDWQVLLQAYAFKHGYIARGEVPYIPRDHDDYHMHEFKHVHGTYYKCRMCNLEVDKYDKYPYEIMVYHVPSCKPKSKKNPEYRVPVTSMNFQAMLEKAVDLIESYRMCCSTNIWARNNQSFMSPCSYCEYANHCEDKILCEVLND